MKKRSLRAKIVAQDVQRAILKGDVPAMGKIVAKRGYSSSTIKHPKRVTETDSYKEEMYNFVQQLERQRDRALQALADKDLTEEDVKTLTDVIDKLNKNVQLATGGNTENIGINLEISEVIASKNGLNKESN